MVKSLFGNRISVLAFGFALLALVGVASIGGQVFAQDATPTPATGETATTAERNEFLDVFAANLGVTDQAAIDAAIQATVDQLLDEKVAAGELTQAEADVIRERIASGEYRISSGIHFGGDHDGFGPGHHHRGDGDRDRDGSKDDAEDALDPAATPSAEATTAASDSSTF